jgi:hypothetical protein
VPAQPVDATPSAINLFSKGGVYAARESDETFREPARRHVVPVGIVGMWDSTPTAYKATFPNGD